MLKYPKSEGGVPVVFKIPCMQVREGSTPSFAKIRYTKWIYENEKIQNIWNRKCIIRL